MLRRLPGPLRELLGVELGGAYALRREEHEIGLDEFHGCDHRDQRSSARYARDFDAALRQSRGVNYLRYDAVRPEPSQQNRVVVISAARQREEERALLRRHDLDRFDQLRVLLCEGDTLLAWVGVLSTEGFRPRHRHLLSAVAPVIRRRVLLERQLLLAPFTLRLLDATLEAVGAPAFLLRNGTVEHCNTAGRAALATDRPGVLAALRAHLAGRGDGAYAITRLEAPGTPRLALAIGRPAAPDARPRAALLASRWGLTARQAEVLGLVAAGRSNRAISAALGCAEGTVEFHVTALLARADCGSRAELVARFWTEGR